MIDLKEFFADFDVQALRQKVLAERGVDIQGIYCLATGKLIGTLDESELRYAVDEIGIDDEEELMDDLIVRVVASMRPSITMNKPNRFTLRERMERTPVDVLAYLVNRLYGHRKLLTYRDGETSFQPLMDRISIHTRWTQLADAGLDLKPWIHWLLELDSKMNLHDIIAPKVTLDKSNQWALAVSGTPLFMLVTMDNAEALLKTFESWTFDRLIEYDKRDRSAIQEANWYRGNTHAQPAYTRSWLENPEIANRKHAEELKRKKAKAKAGRPVVSERTRKLNAEVDQFLHLLEGIIDGGIEVEAPKPKPKVLTGGMLKLNLAGRK
jgi:hypothetical protein